MASESSAAKVVLVHSVWGDPVSELCKRLDMRKQDASSSLDVPAAWSLPRTLACLLPGTPRDQVPATDGTLAYRNEFRKPRVAVYLDTVCVSARCVLVGQEPAASAQAMDTQSGSFPETSKGICCTCFLLQAVLGHRPAAEIYRQTFCLTERWQNKERMTDGCLDINYRSVDYTYPSTCIRNVLNRTDIE